MLLHNVRQKVKTAVRKTEVEGRGVSEGGMAQLYGEAHWVGSEAE